MNRYLCWIIGERHSDVARYHASTLNRIRSHAIAIHIPVSLWALSSFMVARQLFGATIASSILVAAISSVLIYLVERLVLTTPKTWPVNVARLAIGLVMGIIGASVVDLVVFEREVSQELYQSGEARIEGDFDVKLASQTLIVAQSKADWLKAESAAKCEGNGSCGTHQRNLGPVYLSLAHHADVLRKDYVAAQARLAGLTAARDSAVSEWGGSSKALTTAGLLARMDALHAYIDRHPIALVAWALFFILVLACELMVVCSKMVWGRTVDDEIADARERMSLHTTRAAVAAVTSPAADSLRLLGQHYARTA